MRGQSEREMAEDVRRARRRQERGALGAVAEGLRRSARSWRRVSERVFLLLIIASSVAYGIYRVVSIRVGLRGRWDPWFDWIVITWVVVLAIIGGTIIVINLRTRAARANELRRMRPAMLEKVQREPGVPHTRLLEVAPGERRVKETVLRQLLEEGQLRCEQEGRVRRYFPHGNLPGLQLTGDFL